MIFNRSYRLNSPRNSSDIKERLLGKRFQVHKMDFEITEKENMIKVIPRAEEDKGLKTLPITHVYLSGDGNKTKLSVKSKPRKIDVGGPYIISIFCMFCVIGGISLYLMNPEESIGTPLGIFAIGLLIFAIFWFRMETGYFDYIRKIKSQLKKEIA
jgi:hypothetical protein